MLSAHELGLFEEQMHQLDQRVNPGLTKYLWLSGEASSLFVKECLSHVEKVVRRRLYLNEVKCDIM